MSRACLLLLALSWLASACNTKPAEQRSERPAWLRAAKIEALGAGSAFAKNSEVFLKVENPTDEPLVIQALGSEGAASLLYTSGGRAKIHRLSVGVAKPVIVPPRGHKRTSLLFEPAQGSPTKLILYDKEFALPAGARTGAAIAR